MAKAASDYIAAITHQLGGTPDSRLSALNVVNQALSHLFYMHDWKFRKRPPLDVTFQAATAPVRRPISAIVRASNVVTLTVSAAPTPAFSTTGTGSTVVVSGVTNSSFNGTFTVVSVVSATQITYAQTAANASSSGGTAGAFVYADYVDLPSDFGELVDVCTKNSTINNIEQTALPELAWRRGATNSIASNGFYRCALSFPGQESTDENQGLPRLELWPRPTATNVDGDLTLTYRAGPIAVDYVVADPDAEPDPIVGVDTVPNIPLKFERLLELICRLFAQGYEEGKVDEDPLIKLEVAMLLEADGRVQSTVGVLQGGAVQSRGRMGRGGTLDNFASIGNPANRL